MTSFQRTLTVVAILLCLFMSAMETTVINIAIPRVIADLQGMAYYTWVFTIYILGSTVMIPIYGKLSDLYGRKPLLLLGITLFLLGSMACGLSQTMPQLIVFRGIQALGASALQSLAFVIIGDLYTTVQRARMQALFGSVWATASLAGPFIGGLLTKISWRWIFYINVPFGLVATYLLVRFFKEDIQKKSVKVDIFGAILLSATVIVFLLALQPENIHRYWLWSVVAGLLALFIWVQKHTPEPLFPFHLFRQRILGTAAIINIFLGALLSPLILYAVLFGNIVLDLNSDIKVGLLLAPALLGWPVASGIAGRLMHKYGYHTFIRLGLTMVFVASQALAFLVDQGKGPSLWWLRSTMFGLGLGLGMVSTSLVVAAQEVIRKQHRGTATSILPFARSMGGTLSVGLLGVLMAFILIKNGISHERVDTILKSLYEARALHKPIEPKLLAELATPLHTALKYIFHSMGVVSFFALLSGLFFPKLHMKSESECAADAQVN